MAKYDGLIIPRSYNDYINKSDPLGVSQALQLTGVMDDTPTAGSSKPVKSSGLVGLTAVDVVETGNMHSVTSNAVANAMSYSTSEVNTGKKWIDGKTIYRKVILDTTPTHNEEILADVDNLIKTEGFILWSSNTKYPFPFILPSSNTYINVKLLVNHKVVLDIIGSTSELVYICTVLEYTKISV